MVAAAAKEDLSCNDDINHHIDIGYILKISSNDRMV
jgi:hypothetical protein